LARYSFWLTGARRILLAIATCLVATTVAGTDSFAQSSLDQVHIMPNPGASQLSPIRVDPALNASATPIKVKVDLVLVPVTVTDPMNHLVTGLGRENFEILDGKHPQEIRHFSQEDAPVSLGVILDSSGSMKEKIERAREAVTEFLKISNPQDEFFLITFADKPEIISNFGASVEDIQSNLVMSVPKGRTALLDAVYLGISQMKRAKYHKRALLIISDGGDNHSRYTEGELKSLVKEADVAIYAIGIYDHYFATVEEALGPSLLDEISRLTGGRSFTVNNPNDLSIVAKQIGVELRDQYLLGYRPNIVRRDGKGHKIKVRMRLRKPFPQLHVYAKTGYYAPAD
jgi:Ca-activated chloride channel homolog